MPKIILINLLVGVAIFLVGAILHDFMKIHVLGNILAYIGIGYIAISVAVLVFKYKAISQINALLTERENTKANFRNRILTFIIIFIIPLLLHLMIFGFTSIYDPCNNNPGCMAGSASEYFFLLLTVPTIILLFLFSLFQLYSSRQKYKKYLLINMGVSITPFFLALLIYSLK